MNFNNQIDQASKAEEQILNLKVQFEENEKEDKSIADLKD